jgi:hypothetical protein
LLTVFLVTIYMVHAYLFPDFYFPKDMGIMIGQCTLTYGFPSHYMHISFRTCSVFTIANPSLKEFYLRQLGDRLKTDGSSTYVKIGRCRTLLPFSLPAVGDFGFALPVSAISSLRGYKGAPTTKDGAKGLPGPSHADHHFRASGRYPIYQPQHIPSDHVANASGVNDLFLPRLRIARSATSTLETQRQGTS